MYAEPCMLFVGCPAVTAAQLLHSMHLLPKTSQRRLQTAATKVKPDVGCKGLSCMRHSNSVVLLSHSIN